MHRDQWSVDTASEVWCVFGISPLLVFFDATGTTDSAITGNTTAFQDVTYTWNFGDTGASGTDTWAYGSNPGGTVATAPPAESRRIFTSRPARTPLMSRPSRRIAGATPRAASSA